MIAHARWGILLALLLIGAGCGKGADENVGGEVGPLSDAQIRLRGDRSAPDGAMTLRPGIEVEVTATADTTVYCRRI
jgi:hypothetical protein